MWGKRKLTGKPESKKIIASNFSEKGFSLVELMVVMAIIAILALSIVFRPRPAIIDVKKAVFNLTSDLGFARSEAVRRNNSVLVWFDMVNDGYVICEEPPLPAPDAPDSDCADGTDIWIKSVTWDAVRNVRFYDPAGINAPAGPNIEACDGLTCDETAVTFWPDPAGPDKDGVRRGGGGAATDNYITMLTDGSCDANTEIYVYAFSGDDGGNSLKTPPIALVVSQSGVVQLRRWSSGVWTSK